MNNMQNAAIDRNVSAMSRDQLSGVQQIEQRLKMVLDGLRGGIPEKSGCPPTGSGLGSGVISSLSASGETIIRILGHISELEAVVGQNSVIQAQNNGNQYIGKIDARLS